MKNLVKFTLSLIAFLCLSQVISAQAVNQGAWMVGGSGGFRSESPKADFDGSTSNTRIELSPNLGYFIADDLGIGLQFNYFNESNPFFDEDDESLSEFSVGPFIRYYFADALFGQIGVNLGLTDHEHTVDFDDSFTDLEIGVGYSWFVDNAVAIEPKLYYRIHAVKGADNDGDAEDSSIIGLSIGIQAFIDRVGVE